MSTAPSAPTPSVLRALLLGILLLGLLGTGIELLLLGHTEDLWQWSPLILIGASLVALGWVLIAPRRAGVRVFQAIMALSCLSGAVGTWLHYRGNVEFELEMMPGLRGFPLFREAMSGATPALAPGVMIQLGLLGLAYTFRHPARRRDPGAPLQEGDD
jgi:hypothetical protein